MVILYVVTNCKIIVKAMHSFIIFTQEKKRTKDIVTGATMCSFTVYDHM